MLRLWTLLLAALFASITLALIAPPVAATPCEAAGCCGPTVMCTCLACSIPPLVTNGHDVTYCSHYQVLMPVDPKSPPKLECTAYSTIHLP